MPVFKAKPWKPIKKCAEDTFFSRVAIVLSHFKLDPLNAKRDQKDPHKIALKVKEAIAIEKAIAAGEAKKNHVLQFPENSFYFCTKCGNRDPLEFVNSARNADLVCKKCGCVLAERIPYEGDWTRTFADDEVSSTQSGNPHDYRLSSSFNFRTTECMIKNPGRSSENEWGTTDYCRDRQMVRAIIEITHLCDHYRFGKIAECKATDYFYLVRQYREHLHKLKQTKAYCLILALYDQYLKNVAFEEEREARNVSHDCPYCALRFQTPRCISYHLVDCSLVPPFEKENRKRKMEENERMHRKRKKNLNLPLLDLSKSLDELLK